MLRPFRFRLCLLVVLLVPGAAIVGAGLQADAQVRFEKSWRCSRCGGYLGNAVKAPTY